MKLSTLSIQAIRAQKWVVSEQKRAGNILSAKICSGEKKMQLSL
jgi:hypothetical protein